mmetsp:Transcript_3533/g.12532  ORF Transcript_3533/g.12532 Transcript_3533/m.12532 type:complete len:113 (+) Transcript_3533:1897-2235(+)
MALSLRHHSPVPGRTLPVRYPYPKGIPAWTVDPFGPWTGARSSETSLGRSARGRSSGVFVPVSEEMATASSQPFVEGDGRTAILTIRMVGRRRCRGRKQQFAAQRWHRDGRG